MSTATITFVIWICRCGNEISAPENATGVWCPLDGHRGSNRMKRKVTP